MRDVFNRVFPEVTVSKEELKLIEMWGVRWEIQCQKRQPIRGALIQPMLWNVYCKLLILLYGT